MILREITPAEVSIGRVEAVDAETIAGAAKIVEDVRREGDTALARYSARFGDIQAGGQLVYDAEYCHRILNGEGAEGASLTAEDRALLERTAGRIRAFAEAQLASVKNLETPIPGGVAGHDVSPMKRAGCYAPGGRFPLPSSVLMTAVTARAAGVEEVWVASPRPTPMTIAAAAVAGADYLLVVGGAQAISAMAYGTESVSACDIIVGPGNRWVTAAKKLVSGQVAIDMLAGPSELLIIADEHANPAMVAADLLAQAEHDPDAIPALVTPSKALSAAVNEALSVALATLPTAETARAACDNGYIVVVEDLDEAVRVANEVAPEHLEVLTENPDVLARKLEHYGGLFIGGGAAEVLGDYGIGPNHVLPTGRTARSTGGLSVFDFLRIRTWMRVDDLNAARGAVEDAIALARHEGLEGHARSAEWRLQDETMS